MLETRTVSGTIHKTSGEVWPFAEVTFKLRRDAAGDGIVIPQFPEVITADEDGVFECELYTITDGFLPYRCTLPNGKGFKFDLPPGNEITLDVLMDLGELDDSDSVQAAFINALTLALIWENITGKPSSFPPATHNHDDRYFTESETNTAINNAINSLIDSSPTALNTLNELAASLGDDANFATTITNALADKQSLSEKDVNGGYVGLNSSGFIATAITGVERSVSGDHDFRVTKIISREWVSKAISADRYLRVNKQDGYSNIRVNGWDDVPIVDSIWSEEGGAYVDGDEILAINVTNQPIQISANGPTSEGISIYTNEFGTPMLWPADQSVKFIYDSDQGRFRAIPMFSFVDLAFGLIDTSTDIGGSNFHQWHGKLSRVADNYTITFYNDIPDGFRADFESDTVGDVTFAVDGDTIRNRQGHTKIAGQYGVVTVYKRAGYFYLVGDTKA